jgi:transcriptional regulator with XRE-family HTH domain
MPAKGKSKFQIEVMKRVRAVREEFGYSQTEIAGVLGVTRGFIGQIESVELAAMYNLDHLNALASEFECSPKMFFPDSWVSE